MTVTPIPVEDYLRNEVWKGVKQQSDDKLSELQICQSAPWWTIKQNGNGKERHRAKGETAKRKYGYLYMMEVQHSPQQIKH